MIAAQNIEALMVARNINASELARRANLNPTGIYDIIKGKSQSPKIDTIEKIAKALGVPVSLVFSQNLRESLQSEIMSIFYRLPPERQELLIQTARSWLPNDAA